MTVFNYLKPYFTKLKRRRTQVKWLLGTAQDRRSSGKSSQARLMARANEAAETKPTAKETSLIATDGLSVNNWRVFATRISWRKALSGAWEM